MEAMGSVVSLLRILLSFLFLLFMCLLPCCYPAFVAYKVAGKRKNGTVAVWMGVEAVLVLAGTLLYSHWFAYQGAARHLEGQEIVPTVMSVIYALLMIQSVLKLIYGIHNRRYVILLIGLGILLAGCVYAAVFTRGVVCPACNSYSLKDDLYKFFYRLFEGRPWYPAG